MLWKWPKGTPSLSRALEHYVGEARRIHSPGNVARRVTADHSLRIFWVAAGLRAAPGHLVVSRPNARYVDPAGRPSHRPDGTEMPVCGTLIHRPAWPSSRYLNGSGPFPACRWLPPVLGLITVPIHGISQRRTEPAGIRRTHRGPNARLHRHHSEFLRHDARPDCPRA
jgi:hypothetical protein